MKTRVIHDRTVPNSFAGALVMALSVAMVVFQQSTVAVRANDASKDRGHAPTIIQHRTPNQGWALTNEQTGRGGLTRAFGSCLGGPIEWSATAEQDAQKYAIADGFHDRYIATARSHAVDYTNSGPASLLTEHPNPPSRAPPLPTPA